MSGGSALFVSYDIQAGLTSLSDFFFFQSASYLYWAFLMLQLARTPEKIGWLVPEIQEGISKQ